MIDIDVVEKALKQTVIYAPDHLDEVISSLIAEVRQSRARIAKLEAVAEAASNHLDRADEFPYSGYSETEQAMQRALIAANASEETSSSCTGSHCKGKGQAQEPHTCPYQSEINDDKTTLCTCCDDCAHECAMDI